MKTSKLSLSFSRFTDDSLETKAESILQSLTGNANFPSPVPPLTDLQTAITNYSTALVAAATKDRVKVAEKNQYRSQLEAVLNQLGMYVMYVANGNAVMLASSGYDMAKQPQSNNLEEPGVVTITNGITTGQLVASLKRVKGAYSYLYQITPDPLTATSVWDSHAVIKASNTFINLSAGKKYWIRIGAVGSGSQLAFTPLTSQVAQ